VTFFHDAAAAVLRDGEVLAAVEEERFDRRKHSNALPLRALDECLCMAGATLSDVDEIAYFFEDDFLDRILTTEYLADPRLPTAVTREVVTMSLEEYFDCSLASTPVSFVRHHRAHAAAAYFDSGWDDSLVVVIDGNGERESCSVFLGDEDRLDSVATYPISASLGHFYSLGTALLGFGAFDEFKVMGLAPYGDPSVYRDIFQGLYSLDGDGRFQLDFERLPEAFVSRGFPLRRSREPFEKEHQDFAAGMQQTLEVIVGHMLQYWRHETGARRLCLSGGVAHNCSMNGVIAASNYFDDIFVHPASNDAGAALGAAMASVADRHGMNRHRVMRRFVALGPPAVRDHAALDGLLAQWAEHIEYEQVSDRCTAAADALVRGDVVGWVQGRSEFGPRALGNRSILADPRIGANRDRVNALVKKREAFRPFAPAVTAEAADQYFVIADAIANPEFMAFVVPVRPDARDALPAVTHVDGTARLQVVHRDHAPDFWRVIDEFGKRTGVAVVLNTSFNNYAEPIVQSPADALRTFLSTRLDLLIIEDYVIRKRRALAIHELVLRLADDALLHRTTQRTDSGMAVRHSVGWRHEASARDGGRPPIDIAPSTAELIADADSATTIAALVGDANVGSITSDVLALWERRLIDLTPSRHATAGR
jgi:predicted NodU family carbamoyl transferase